LAIRAYTAWLDAVDAWRHERAEADHAEAYFGLSMDVDEVRHQDEDYDVTAVLHAASGFLSHSPVLPVQQSFIDSLDYSQLMREFVGAESTGGRRSISPPGSSPSEAAEYRDSMLGSSIERQERQPKYVVRTSSRRVAIDDAVGANALLAGAHNVCVAKKSAKGGFGIYISDSLQVTSCAAGSPAEEAGLQVGCTITKVNDHPISSREEFRRHIEVVRPGENVAFTCSNITSGKPGPRVRVGRSKRVSPR
jgi:hypothetical protein